MCQIGIIGIFRKFLQDLTNMIFEHKINNQKLMEMKPNKKNKKKPTMKETQENIATIIKHKIHMYLTYINLIYERTMQSF